MTQTPKQKIDDAIRPQVKAALIELARLLARQAARECLAGRLRPEPDDAGK
jgi:hypothetical protein